MNQKLEKLPPALYAGEIRVIDHELGYAARAQVPEGYIYFIFTEISHARQSIDGVLEIEVDTKGGIKQPFVQRIDIRSSSAISKLVTDLNNAFGGKRDEKGFNWALILNGVVAEFSKSIKKSQKAEYLVGTVFTEPVFLLPPFLQENSPNLLFAETQAGKTWLAIRLGVSLITGQQFLGYNAPVNKKVLFIDYEDEKSTFASRLHKVCAGAKIGFDEVAINFPYYRPSGSLRENVEVVKKIISEEKIDLIIIDAGGDAAGGSPSDEAKVLELFNSLSSLPVTKLLLHHEPKYVVSEAAAFYGSMYWKARSRVAWRLEVESEEDGVKLIKASIQKRSNLPYIEPIYYKTHFNVIELEEVFDESKTSPIIPAVKFQVVTEAQLKKEKPIDEAVIQAIESEGQMTINQLSKFVGRDASVVGKTLRGHLSASVEQKKVGREIVWRLKK